MKPKTRFLKMYYKLPKKARENILIKCNYGIDADCYIYYTLTQVFEEVKNNRALGKHILRELEFDEVEK